MVKETTIKLSRKFKEKLKGLGRKGETYEDIIKRNFKQQKIK